MCIRNRNFLLSKLLLLRFTVWFLNGFLISVLYIFVSFIILLYKFIYNFNLYSSYFLFLLSFFALLLLFSNIVLLFLLLLALAALRPPYIEKNFFSLAYNLYLGVLCVCVWYIGNLLLLLIRILLLDLIQTPILKLNALPTSTAAAAASAPYSSFSSSF